ncbi:class I SAM-dependent methyltransferase [Methanobacterium spitsbergense]|nr:class I SAM-dependent methyltransferase family protein [Methanobacterium spitsbergense]
MIGLKVLKNNADRIRRFLLKQSLINLDMKIKRVDDFVYIPLIKMPDNELMEEIKVDNVEIVDTNFEIHKKGPKSLKDYLKNKVDNGKIEDIKKSFDIIGNIVILEIPEDFDDHKYIIGEAALKFTKRNSVYRKISEIKGIVRTRELEYLSGEDVSETVHKEFGSRFLLDVKKVYFSPRLATERKRITDHVKNNEIIVDMFTGIGPFSISIARKHKVKIYAIDINPYAYKYLKKNINLNKLEGNIIPILGDVEEVLNGLNLKADRIIMNLPGTAWNFLDTAIKSLKPGGILHYYEFASDYQQPIERIIETAYPRKVEILNSRKVKSKSPGVWHMGIDARIY